MANPTTNFGWVMPTATDLVTDLPADFAVFGQGVDTSMAYLLGGTTGQILSKTSATNMAFTWINNDQGDLTAITAGTGISVTSGTGPIPSVAIDTAVTVDKTTAQTLTNKTLTSPALTTPTISTLTTNGDLVYGTGSGALSRLGIGSSAQVLTVASGVPSWATPSGSSGPTFMAYSLTGNQNVTGTTWTAVTLSSEDWDSDSCYSTSTYRFTPTKSGYYQFNWMLQCSNTTLKSMWSAIYKNGSVHKYGTYTQMTTLDGSGNVGGSAVVYMNGSTDYVALYGLVEAGGGTPRFYAYGVENSRFDGVWIRS